MIFSRLPILFVAVAPVCGCGRRGSPSTSSAAAAVSPETWAAKPSAEWPPLVLTNEASFKGHTPLHGASGFLVRSADGRILASTARHLLGVNGGVEPEVRPGGLATDLAKWTMYPRTKGKEMVSVSGFASGCPEVTGVDWLLLSLTDPAAKLPVQPLKLRGKPVEVGEEIFLVGVPYSEPDRQQNVYRCRVTARSKGDYFRYSIDPPVNFVGFSGAPILDRDGLVVGSAMVWFEPKMEGEKFLEGGGEDASTLVKAGF